MYDTSVTIVIISPNMKKSKWIDWEIEYCLKSITRKDRTSHTNGVVGVIMKHNGGYSWLKTTSNNDDGCSSSSYDSSKMYDIINNNHFNQNPKVYSCDNCKTVNSLTGSYIALVEEEDYLMWLQVILQTQNGVHGSWDILMERKMQDAVFCQLLRMVVFQVKNI